jgi:viroplasmin and RNaseH domain-containing protein
VGAGSECEKLVKGFSGAIYKGFPSWSEAECWLNEGAQHLIEIERKESHTSTSMKPKQAGIGLILLFLSISPR